MQSCCLKAPRGSSLLTSPWASPAESWLGEAEDLLASAGIAEEALVCDADWLSSLMTWHASHPQALVGDLVAVGSGLVGYAVEPGGSRPGSLMSEGVLTEVLDRFCLGPVPALPGPFLSVQDLFADHARQHPDQVAIIAADGTRTFADLELSSRLLAHRLLDAGAAPNSVTAVIAPRDSSLIVAMLAVWRAGSAFLLLDPLDPRELSEYKLGAASATTLWCDERCAVDWRTADRVQVVHGLSAAGDGRATSGGADLPEPLPAAQRTDLAYVIFTSGSTGRPKGVQIEHAGLIEHVMTQLAPVYDGLGDDGRPLRVGGTAPVTFDSFIDQVLPMAAFGHTLVLFDDRRRTDPESFTSPQAGLALDVLDCTPSQLSILVGQGLLDQAHPPQLIVFAGEKPSQDLWNRLRGSDIRAVNIYGATECTIGSLHAEVHDAPEVTIGLPEGSARVYILDNEKRILPPGLVGEVYLAGPGVARGYIGYSNDAFMADPFADTSGSRMYRTGDLGRIGLHGHLEFLGRRDDQLKVRGFRVEPGEIEAVLESMPGIEQAVIVPAPAEGPPTHLVVFLVRPEGGPEWDEVRRWATDKLPAHMVPSRAEFCSVLPLTHNGKVDRAALRRQIASMRPGPTDAERPAGAVEQLILDTWVEVLNVPGAGVTDDFAELGGHSLAAMEIVARLRSVLDQQIPMDIALRARTVRSMAAAFSRQGQVVASEEEP